MYLLKIFILGFKIGTLLNASRKVFSDFSYTYNEHRLLCHLVSSKNSSSLKLLLEILELEKTQWAKSGKQVLCEIASYQ